MDVLRTPDARFADLPDYPFAPHYATVGAGALRMHVVDEGPPEAPVVVLLHGEPSWSYLYRRVIAGLAAAGLRALAVDLVGFGKSDKPAAVGDHSYAAHVEWTRELLFDVLDLRRVTLVGQDWGGLIGLRLVAEHPDRFARVVVANTGLPTGEHEMPPVWWQFRRAVETAAQLDVGRLVAAGCVRALPPGVRAAYDAPFPEGAYLAGPRAMPGLVPTRTDDPASAANRAAWEALARFSQPFLTAFSDSDPITRGMAEVFQRVVPGAAGCAHTTIRAAGHFLQEDAGAVLTAVIADFVASTPGAPR